MYSSLPRYTKKKISTTPGALAGNHSRGGNVDDDNYVVVEKEDPVEEEADAGLAKAAFELRRQACIAHRNAAPLRAVEGGCEHATATARPHL